MTGQLAYYSLHELSEMIKKYDRFKLAIENEETKNGR